MNQHEHLIALDSTRDILVPYFYLERSVLENRYAPKSWTARQMLIHITDAEGVFLDRLQRVLSENNAVLQAFNQDLWMARMGTEWRQLKDVCSQFVITRAAIRALVCTMSPLDFTLLGNHSEAGLLTADQIVTKVHAHTLHHLAQLHAAVTGTAWSPAKA